MGRMVCEGWLVIIMPEHSSLIDRPSLSEIYFFNSKISSMLHYLHGCTSCEGIGDSDPGLHHMRVLVTVIPLFPYVPTIHLLFPCFCM